MSCFVRIETAKSIREFEFHIGSPLVSLTDEEKNGCVWLQADGEELDFILKVTRNLPFCERKVITWFGDDSRFIFKNVCCK